VHDRDDRADTGGVVPGLSTQTLVAAVPGLAETGVTVEIEDFRQVPGASVSWIVGGVAHQSSGHDRGGGSLDHGLVMGG